MAQKNRATLKTYFEIDDKPTEQQFADLIDSIFNLVDDGGVKVRQLLELLQGSARLKKSAIRGADFALNRRGKGNVWDGNYQVQMTNILKGDFWIYEETEPPPPDATALAVGDWVVAMRDGLTPAFDFENAADWMVVHFGDTSVQQNTLDLHSWRHSPTVDTEVITMQGIHAQVTGIVINRLTYKGKLDDGTFDNYDYVYRHVGTGTEIQINTDRTEHPFRASMVIDVDYLLIQQ